jgi:hypothetical protein
MALAGSDYFAAYLLIGAWVPLAVALAAGFAAGGRAGLAATGALCAAMLAVTISVPAGDELRRPDFRAAAEKLDDARAPRAVVATPDNSFAPLEHYQRDLGAPPAAGPRVAEVAVIGMDSADGSFRERAEGSLPVTAPPGFAVAERVETGRFTLVRYRAPRPRVVTFEELVEARLGEGGASIALQRPGG